MSEDELTRLREEIRRLDAEVIDLATKRLQLARRAGELKSREGVPIRNYAVEAEVLRLARDRAESDGIAPDFAESIIKLLIQESLRAQERDRRTTRRDAAGSARRRALVVGGLGNMGRWFVEFLESKGFGVSIADPLAGENEPRPVVRDLVADADSFEIIVIATPPSAVGPTLRALQGHTEALIFEIGSLKSPFLADLRKLSASGMAITSVHPMWGPKTDLLASKNVIVCDCGNEDANRAAAVLFEDTAARLVEMPVEDHDSFMARTLVMPHALNLLFGRALRDQGIALNRLLTMGGPTFAKQVAAAREVAGENKDLYYEIQTLNPHTDEALGHLRASLDALQASLASREAFRTYMRETQQYFEGVDSA